MDSRKKKVEEKKILEEKKTRQTMNVIRFSQFLIVAFVGSVTLWYFVTPYIVQPHPGIVQEM